MAAGCALAWPATASAAPQPAFAVIPSEAVIADREFLPYWTPTDDEARQAIAAVKTYLSSSTAREDAYVLAKFDDYVFQVIGKTAQAGNADPGAHRERSRILVIHAFCSADETDRTSGDWRREEIIVSDGGDCFFTAVYDPDGRRMGAVTINPLR